MRDTVRELLAEPIVQLTLENPMTLPLWQECATWTDEQYRAMDSLAKAAIAAAPDWCSTMDKISASLTVPEPQAIDLLRNLWLHCAIEGVRRGAAATLHRMNAPEANAALAPELERYDCTRDAALAILRRSPSTAYDEFQERFTKDSLDSAHGKIIAETILGVLAPIGIKGDKTPVWRDLEVPRWLSTEPRWGTLAKSLKRSPVAEVARAVERGRREAGIK